VCAAAVIARSSQFDLPARYRNAVVSETINESELIAK
jgi:hypothetical protein